MTGGEVVAAVEYDIGSAHEFLQPRGIGALAQGDDVDVGIDLMERLAPRFDLGLAHARGRVHHLALQVREVDGVVVDERQASDAGGGQVQRGRRAEAAGADHEHAGAQDAVLAFDADLVEQDMARVAQQLLVVHRLTSSAPGACGPVPAARRP